MLRAYEFLVQRGIYGLDLLDIFVVGILIYLFIYQVRGTRAAHIFAGILLLYLLYLLSNLLMMNATSRLLQKTFFYIPFAVIVLFQPAIRNVLSGLGGLIMGKKAVREKSSRICVEIARAAFNLASNRFGAIIVLERKQGLKNYAETGCPMGEAEITADLLLTIFYPKTPLHDGAIIISDGVIIASGAFLPLSSLPLPTLYGTRHRAALGITEETDAIAVVVSEERGEVSIAVSGKLIKMDSEEKLKDKLSSLLRGGN